MSRQLRNQVSDNNGNVHNASFSGGVERGRCFQMSQMHRTNFETQVVQLTKEQVVHQMAVMAEWLAE